MYQTALTPETAKTYSVGVILTPGNLRATVDFWRFDFDNPIATEPVGGIVSAVFPNGAAGANNCANPALAALVAHGLLVAGPQDGTYVIGAWAETQADLGGSTTRSASTSSSVRRSPGSFRTARRGWMAGAFDELRLAI